MCSTTYRDTITAHFIHQIQKQKNIQKNSSSAFPSQPWDIRNESLRAWEVKGNLPLSCFDFGLKLKMRNKKKKYFFFAANTHKDKTFNEEKFVLIAS